MRVVSFRVSEEIKRKMDKYKHINWAEILREAIRRRIEIEEAIRGEIDLARAMRASEDMKLLRSKCSGRWRGVEEIRKWRERRR